MNNTIEYFYKIKPRELTNINGNYIFTYNNDKYYLNIYERKEDIQIYISLVNKLKYQNILVSEIILNKDKSYITFIENTPYYLLKVNINEQIPLRIQEINYLSQINLSIDKELIRNNWSDLWIIKIDYLERQIKEMGKKYPILVESFNYYVGLTENAISYINDTIIELTPQELNNKVLSHRKINNNLSINQLYDPTNIIFDHKARDISEYVKKSFLKGNKEIYTELSNYLNKNLYTRNDIRILFGRLLYPSYYYEIFDNVIQNKEEENSIIPVINKIPEYEIFLKKIFKYFKQTYDIPNIEWLN